MKCKSSKCLPPRYRGRKWLQTELPRELEPWHLGRRDSLRMDSSTRRSLQQELQRVVHHAAWRWPKRTTYFFSDLHGDADAFFASLVASGGVRKTGPKDSDFELTRVGKTARFLIGGDCFDKGPSNLRLLRCIRMLKKKGARLHLLAGNHDVRMLLGMRAVDLEDRDPRTDHFFIRMGRKSVPFLKEIHDEYLKGPNALKGIPNTRECRRRMYPPRRWFREFPDHARWVMPDKGIDKEVKKLRTKMDNFEADCDAAGLNLRQIYAAARKWKELFLHPKGEFAWFFRKMKLAYRDGSFLFIHAGLDDGIADFIRRAGIDRLNSNFRAQLYGDLFDFYYGPLANVIRTKYRDVDRPLTRRGVRHLHHKKIHAIVHGHLNLLRGQRIMLRKGLLNFECDATVDRNTRRREGLKGIGGAVAIFRPEGTALGISSDYPAIKLFKPQSYLAG